MESPNATAPNKHRYVLPLLLLIIVGGVAAPFILSTHKHTELAANETAVVELIHAYSKAQDEAFKARGEYAKSFGQLQLPDAFPELDAPKSPALHGYRFRILTESANGSWLDEKGRLTKGYGLIAVPADYMVTGRDTFLVNGHEIHAVDFNVRTAQLTREIRAFSIPQGAQKVE
jgi:hypothetical protein